MRFTKLISLILAIIFFGFGGLFFILEADANNQVPKKPNSYSRIISLAPSFCETLHALDEAHRLVGVTIHSNIEETKGIAKIGSFASPNLEAILALKPDLVLAIPHVLAISTIKALEERKIEIFAHQPDTLKDIKYIITQISKKLNVEKKGENLNKDIDISLLKFKNKIAPYVEKIQQKTILVAISHSPFVVAGKNTFASQIIESLGLKNEARDSKVAWPIWPLEKLLTKPPHFLIISHGEEGLSYYKSLFLSIGLKDYEKMLIVPRRPIFSIPSPSVMADTEYFCDLLLEKINYNETR